MGETPTLDRNRVLCIKFKNLYMTSQIGEKVGMLIKVDVTTEIWEKCLL